MKPGRSRSLTTQDAALYDGDERTCQDCGRTFLISGGKGGIPKRCGACRKKHEKAPAQSCCPTCHRPIALLTPAQWRAVEQISLGRLNKEVAYALGVGPATIKTHISRLRTRLKVMLGDKAPQTRLEIALWYRDLPADQKPSKVE